jgi:Nucleotidyltransferase/DNA polymerase involved in DNA repair
MFAIIDCNNFFVSCEKVFNPMLEGRSVVVLSNNDGCVVSRSAEAKKMGIRMGLPAYKMKEEMGLNVITSKEMKKEEGKNEVIAFSSNYNLYGDMSRRVVSVIHNIIGEVEIYSIDEVFVDLEGIDIEEIKKLAAKIVYLVKKNTGIPVCVGIGETKTLAKVANRFAKKYKGYNGFA